jgi:hypothetical protein
MSKTSKMISVAVFLGLLTAHPPSPGSGEPGFTRHSFAPTPGTKAEYLGEIVHLGRIHEKCRVVSFRPAGDEILFYFEANGKEQEGHLPVAIVRLESSGRLSDKAPSGPAESTLEMLPFFLLVSFEGPPLGPGAHWESSKGTVVEKIPVEGKLERRVEEVPGKPGMIRVISRRKGKDLMSPFLTLAARVVSWDRNSSTSALV